MRGGILRVHYPGWIAANRLGGDVGGEAAQRDEEAVGGEGLAGEAASVVADEGEVTDPANKSGLDALASRGTRLDGNSLKHSNLPHGGRQLSWWDHGRCHRMA